MVAVTEAWLAVNPFLSIMGARRGVADEPPEFILAVGTYE